MDDWELGILVEQLVAGVQYTETVSVVEKAGDQGTNHSPTSLRLVYIGCMVVYM